MWLSYNPAIALLGIYPREIKKSHSQKKTCTPMSIATLFVTAKTTQVSFNGWMIKQTVVHPYHGILFSNKKEWTIHICNNLDRSQINCAEWRKGYHF